MTVHLVLDRKVQVAVFFTSYLHAEFGKELTEAERKDLKRDYPEIYALTRWNLMKRNPDAYVKGRISHADHGTIILPTWHQVVMNTEHRAKAMVHVTFLD